MKHKYLPLLIVAAFAGISSTAQASGYRFGSQSVAAQGTADASGAEAGDASTVFYNPAGLSRLEGTQFVGGGTIVVPHSTYQDMGSKAFYPSAARAPFAATKDYAPDAVVAPALYASKKINEQWTVGAGLFVPYGAKLDYGNDWYGRYAITHIKLEAIALNPSVSFKLDQHHAFGFGITAEYMKAELGQGVDVPGSVAYLHDKAPAASKAFLDSIGMMQGQAAKVAAGLALQGAKDGHASMNGHDWGFGFNLGYLYQMNEGTRFGISYRSSISHKLKGITIWDFSQVSNNAAVNAFVAKASRKANSEALVELRTPETVSVNAFHQMDDRWALMGDVTWTRTSRLQNLDIQFPPTAEGAERIRQNWKDTYRVSLGSNYKYSESLMLRAGIAHDQAPVRSAELRHPALPDSDRMQYSIGANWKLNANSSIDLAYSYIDFKDAPMNYKNDCTPVSPITAACTGNGETTKGLFKTRMQLIGLAYNYKF